MGVPGPCASRGLDAGHRLERPGVSGPVRRAVAGGEFGNLACQRLRDALVAVWGEISGDPMVEPHRERGPAGWVLVSLACHPADVLLVGAGRRSAAGWMAFPKVTRYCLAHAQCPVLAVPPPELARELGRGRLARDAASPAADCRTGHRWPAQPTQLRGERVTCAGSRRLNRHAPGQSRWLCLAAARAGWLVLQQ